MNEYILGKGVFRNNGGVPAFRLEGGATQGVWPWKATCHPFAIHGEREKYKRLLNKS